MAKSIVFGKIYDLIEKTTGKTAKEFKEKLLAQLQELEAAEGYKVANAPEQRDDGMYYYCRYHQRYEHESDMVITNGKSKGYCKAGNKKWNKMYNDINKLKAKIAEHFMNGNHEAAVATQTMLRECELNLNSVKSFDYDADWEAYRNGKSAPTENK